MHQLQVLPQERTRGDERFLRNSRWSEPSRTSGRQRGAQEEGVAKEGSLSQSGWLNLNFQSPFWWVVVMAARPAPLPVNGEKVIIWQCWPFLLTMPTTMWCTGGVGH